MSEWDNDIYSVYVIGRAASEEVAKSPVMKPHTLTGPVKVGITGNLNSRLSTIQTACPFRIALAWTFDCPTKGIAQDIERCFHQTQKANRQHGEWFSFEPIQAVHLLCIAYRTLLRTRATKLTPYDYEAILNFAGVLTVENRYQLLTPEEAADGSHPHH
jgi:hypothetical protein